MSHKMFYSEGLPFATFLAVHFEVGGNNKSLKYQKTLWPAAVNLIKLANQYNAKLSLQFTPQWAEYILGDNNKFNTLKNWQKDGHEVSLHHHGYDHGDWDGYTNRPGVKDNPRFRGNIEDMMELIKQLVYPYQVLSGTITDEEFDYPEGIKFDTEGIQIYHARTKPKRVTLASRDVIQVGMAFLYFEENIEMLKNEYLKSDGDEIFGVVAHEIDFAENPENFIEWMKFIKSREGKIQTVSEIITNYQKVYPVELGGKPLIFSKDVT